MLYLGITTGHRSRLLRCFPVFINLALGCCQVVMGVDQAEAEKAFEALQTRYRDGNERAWAEIEKTTDSAARGRIYEERHPANLMVADFLKFEEAHRGTMLGFSALHHLVSVAGGNGFVPQFSGSEGGRQATRILAAHYADHPDLDVLFEWIGSGGDDAKMLLKRAMTSSHRYVRGAAILKLAEIHKAGAQGPVRFDSVLELLAAAPDKYADKIELYTTLRKRWHADREASRQEALRLLNQVQEQYADVLEPPRTGYGPVVLKIVRSVDDPLTLSRRKTLAERAESMAFDLTHLSIGQSAPEIAGPDAFGNQLKLSDQRGRVTVLMFSFKGCGPCEAMYPGNRKLVEIYRGRPFAFLGVMGDDELATVKKSVSSGTITWPVWWDGERRGPIASRWNVVGWPDVYVLDHKGIIRYSELTSDLLELAVASLMNGAEQPR
jgi:peroxiredoxin